MGFEVGRCIPAPEEIGEEIPLPHGLAARKAARDGEIAGVLSGADGRKIVIAGPCSADREDAVLEYCERLAGLQERVSDGILVIPRIHTNRGSRDGEGYKGMLLQPDPAGRADMLGGLRAVRRLNVRVIEQSGLFAADEILYPDVYPYVSDLLAYGIVGTRSVEDQQHKLFASGLDIAIGMATPTGGDMGIMLGSIYAAQRPQVLLHRGCEVATSGNPLAHALLQGAVDAGGKKRPNYTYDSLAELVELYADGGSENPAFIVDCSHNNSRDDFRQQPRIADAVLDSCGNNRDIANAFKGFMIESYLEEGCQGVGGGEYGKSITDPCLGWDATERMILAIAERVS